MRNCTKYDIFSSKPDVTFDEVYFLWSELRKTRSGKSFRFAVCVYLLFHNTRVIALFTEDRMSVYSQLRIINILLTVINNRPVYFVINHYFIMAVFSFEPANRRMFTNLSLDNYINITRLLTCLYIIYHNIRIYWHVLT